MTWDQHSAAFQQISKDDIDEALQYCAPHKLCFPCGLAVLHSNSAAWAISEDEDVSRNGISYHTGDFVYIRPPGSQSEVYAIAQIEDINISKGNINKVRIRQYGRYDDVARLQQWSITDPMVSYSVSFFPLYAINTHV